MRKVLIILFCLPLFLFSQEERKYERTMSVSQFAKELKQAAERGTNYILKNCKITYDPLLDKEYVLKNTGDKEFKHDAVIKDIHFNDSTFIVLSNCKFGKRASGYVPTFTFSKCSFGWLYMKDINVGAGIFLDSISAEKIEFRCDEELADPYNITIENSKIKELRAYSYITSQQNQTLKSAAVNYTNQPTVSINKNIIRNTNISGFNTCFFRQNRCHALLLGGIYTDNNKFNTVWIEDNIFSSEINPERLVIYNYNLWRSDNYNGIFVSNAKIDFLTINNNKAEPLEKFNSESFNALKYKVLGISSVRYISARRCKDTLRLQEEIYDDTWALEKKIDFMKRYFSSKNIIVNINPAKFEITGCEIEDIFIKNNSTSQLNVIANTFSQSFYAFNNDVDSIVDFRNNALPSNNRTGVDASFFKNLGTKYNWRDTAIYTGEFFYFRQKTLYGQEKYNDIKIYRENDKDILANLIQTYRQFITLLKYNGNPLSNKLAIKLKDIQSNIRMYEYYESPNMENWFNWQGSVFLKWYSDYGTNPFKALAYCFWAMLYFAMFYFFFYSEWDKIDRGFIIKRFNNVMVYFTTVKRIEDFYSSTHDKEMTTFTDFKDTLDKNKVYMPSMLASLAKPIYQISLLRYKLLNFSYKKAEFMAGRKWIDLEKKDRYWIGTLTFFLTLTYIIYLVFIRALNSIVLSINAFSTLGFGQIPVRGFTKYVAIIEGFIGWFMLSVFIVSLLGQMMSV
jgi:hypothetical protein